MTTRSEAEAIAAKWVERFGLGFHPDTRGTDYVETRGPNKDVRCLTDEEAAEYEREMDALYDAPGDVYDYGIFAMSEAG